MRQLREALRRRYEDTPQAQDYFTFPVLFAALCEKHELAKDALTEPPKALANTLLSEAQALLDGQPLQYYLGEAEFCGEPFAVREGVLIPRPQTQMLVARALDLLEEDAVFYDLCCGSGCIGVSILKQRPRAVCIAVDVDETALGLTEENARRHGVRERLTVRRRDLLAEPAGAERLSLLCMNPPYIRSGALSALAGNVRREPRLALDGGADGMRFYRHILKRLPVYLREDGTALMEIGYDQEEAMRALCAAHSLAVRVERDADGHPRLCVITFAK